jgi:hypothetical protein
VEADAGFLHDHLHKLHGYFVGFQRVADEVVEDTGENSFASFSFEFFQELSLVFENVFVDLSSNGSWVLHDLEGQDIGNGGYRHEDSLKDVGVEVIDDARWSLIDQFIEDSQGCVLVGKNVIVVVLVGVEPYLMRILQGYNCTDEQPHDVLHCFRVNRLISDFLHDPQNEAPDKLFRFLRNFLDKVLFSGDENPFAQVLNHGLQEEFGVLRKSDIFNLIFNCLSMVLDLVLDFFPDPGQDRGRNCEVLRR